jgi:hypothetical protein
VLLRSAHACLSWSFNTSSAVRAIFVLISQLLLPIAGQKAAGALSHTRVRISRIVCCRISGISLPKPRNAALDHGVDPDSHSPTAGIRAGLANGVGKIAG